jgi:hypothetical protein
MQSRVGQRLSNLIDHLVKSLIKVPETVRRPKFPFKLLSGNYGSTALNQHFQDLKWLCLKPDSDSMFSDLTCLEIDLITLERDAP